MLNGLFILDANATERFDGIQKRPALFNSFDNNYFWMKLKKPKQFYYRRKSIEETTETGSKIFQSLKKVFNDVTVYNGKYKWLYSCRKENLN